MAVSSLWALLDDMGTLLDDIGTLSQVAAKKTSGVLSDDLAVNANLVNGGAAERELPVVWAVAKGSFVNKFILIPIALFIGIYMPSLLNMLLVLGGCYLCFEGAEKVLEKFLHHEKNTKLIKSLDIDLVSFEKAQIKGAIRTDFVLSAEIIVITIGTVASASMWVQLGVLVLTAVVMTIGVYGLVALIVKLDDIGLSLIKSPKKIVKKIGNGLVVFAPKLLKILAIGGTIAMFLVGGGIITHFIHSYIHFDLMNNYSTLYNMLVGFLVGCIIVGIYEGFRKIKKLISH